MVTTKRCKKPRSSNGRRCGRRSTTPRRKIDQLISHKSHRLGCARYQTFTVTIKERLLSVECDPQRCRPAAKRMNDTTQGIQCSVRALPSRTRGNTAHCAALEVGCRILRHVLGIIERVLHQPGDAPMITGRADDDRVSFAERLQQSCGSLASEGFARNIGGKTDHLAREEQSLGAKAIRMTENMREHFFGRGSGS